MSTRFRLIYDKRGGACFVPHVSLASLFTRAALRAGVSLTLTQGFSPHPRMSFGPELPAGVVALAEPVDVWTEGEPEEMLSRWDAALPEGFRLLRVYPVAEDAPSLGKVCLAARYWVCGELRSDELLERARAYYGEAVLDAEAGLDVEANGQPVWLSLKLSAPAQNGIGGWVKQMIADGAIAGWQALHIIRVEVELATREGRS